MLSVLADSDMYKDCLTAILQETSTIGVRVREVGRVGATRRFVQATTPWGDVAVKISSFGGQVINIAPEYEDCKKLARQCGVPLKKIQQCALNSVTSSTLVDE